MSELITTLLVGISAFVATKGLPNKKHPKFSCGMGRKARPRFRAGETPLVSS